jgi:hypothetical protein
LTVMASRFIVEGGSVKWRTCNESFGFGSTTSQEGA